MLTAIKMAVIPCELAIKSPMCLLPLLMPAAESLCEIPKSDDAADLSQIRAKSEPNRG